MLSFKMMNITLAGKLPAASSTHQRKLRQLHCAWCLISAYSLVSKLALLPEAWRSCGNAAAAVVAQAAPAGLRVPGAQAVRRFPQVCRYTSKPSSSASSDFANCWVQSEYTSPERSVKGEPETMSGNVGDQCAWQARRGLLFSVCSALFRSITSAQRHAQQTRLPAYPLIQYVGT